MKNLHLKNLNNTEPVEHYLNEIDKQNEKIFKYKKSIFKHLITQLKNFNFKNSQITNYTNRYIKSLESLDSDDISIMYTNRIDFEDDNNNIKNLEKLQNININTKFDINNIKYLYYEKKKTYNLITIMCFRNTDGKVEYLELEVKNNIIKNIDINIPQ
jgi:hypothetical protein